jgi:hypothetical protein
MEKKFFKIVFALKRSGTFKFKIYEAKKVAVGIKVVTLLILPSGSGKPKNMWIRYIQSRIRIRKIVLKNNDDCLFFGRRHLRHSYLLPTLQPDRVSSSEDWG